MRTVTIEITPELEDRLQKAAARHGLPVAEYVQAALEKLLEAEKPEKAPLFYATATVQQWEEAFRQWAAGHDATIPPVPLEMLRRESLYEDTG